MAVFKHMIPGLTSPGLKSQAVDLSADDATFDPPSRALYTGTGGTIVLQLADDSAWTTLVHAQPGAVLPFRIKAVQSAGTLATNLVAIW